MFSGKNLGGKGKSSQFWVDGDPQSTTHDAMNRPTFDFHGFNNNNNHNHLPSGLRALEGDDKSTAPSLASENEEHGGSHDDFLGTGLANNDDAESDPEELGVVVPGEVPARVEVRAPMLEALLTLANNENGELRAENRELRAKLKSAQEGTDAMDHVFELEEAAHKKTREELEALMTELEALKEDVLNGIAPVDDDTVESLAKKLRDTLALLKSECDRYVFEKLKLGDQVDDLQWAKSMAESNFRHEKALLEEKIEQLLVENAKLRSGKWE